MPKQTHLSAVFVVAALTINCNASALCKRCFEKMNKSIARITQKVDRLFTDSWLDTVQAQAAKAATQKTNGFCPQQKLTINQEGDAITVKLQLGKGVTNIDANIKNNQLLVEIPEKNQKIFLDYEKEGNYLAIAIGQSVEKKEEQEGAHRESAFFSSIQHGQTLNQPVNFDKAKIEYKDETLTISIPKKTAKKEKKSKKILVGFK